MKSEAGDDDRDPAYESEYGAQIPATWLTLVLGGFAMLIAALGQFGPTRKIISYIDLPMTLIVFIFAALVAGRAEQKAAGGIIGMGLAGLAVLIAAAGIFLRRDHPWLG